MFQVIVADNRFFEPGDFSHQAVASAGFDPAVISLPLGVNTAIEYNPRFEIHPAEFKICSWFREKPDEAKANGFRDGRSK